MIKKLNLENFKSFKSLKDFEIKPITIVCGTNSCGKSSILQSILALKQTIESQSNNQVLLLNGKYVHLGVFENLVFEKKQLNEVTINVEFALNTLRTRHLIRSLSKSFNQDDIDHSKTKLSIEIKLKTLRRIGTKILRPIRVLSYSLNISSFSKKNEKYSYNTNVTLTHNKSERYNLSWTNLSSQLHSNLLDDDDRKQDGSINVNCRFINLVPFITSSHRTRNIDIFFWSLRDILKLLLKNYSYIGPLREEASRRYIYENEITEIGLKGENAAYLYMNESEEKISYYTLDKEKNIFMKKKSTLKNAVNEWLSKLGINGFDSNLANEIIHLNLKANEYMNVEVNIADVGFGISQIFPIILEGLRIHEKDTLILEQPEIHLHPKMQMDMADYFLSLAMADKNLLIETHSEHMINRLVRRIIEDESGTIEKLVAIYFVSQKEDGANVEKVNIDPLSGITNWPEGFFDQGAIEQEKIILAGINRRRKEREKNQ